MRARRRIFIVSVCVLLFVAAVALVVVLRKQAAPEAARLLPEADAVLYIDFGTVRSLTAFDQQPLPKLAPGYDEFVKNTGFAFERDLDEAAMAMHRGSAKDPAHGATRYTEILVGHYDQVKLAQYLRQHSRSVESYRDVDVFSIPIENRTLRVALLAIDTVAVSNVDDPDSCAWHHRPLQESGAALRRPQAGAHLLFRRFRSAACSGRSRAFRPLARISLTPRPRSPCPAASISDSPATAMSSSHCAC